MHHLVQKVGQTFEAVQARFEATAVGRALKRYGDARGSLLAGGVAYFAFFSIFPAIALAFSIFGLVLRDHPEILEQIKTNLNERLPGFVKMSPDSPEGLIPIEPPSGATLTTAGIIGLVVLLWAGLGWLGALREGIRAVFGVPGAPGNFALAKLRDLGVLVALGVGMVVSAAVSVAATSAAHWTADHIGLGNQGWLLSGVGLAVGFLLDSALVLLILRVLTGVDVPWRGLRSGALLGGAGLMLLKLFGSRLLAVTMRNPLFASIALVVGLLLWLQFMSRLMLLSAAVAANELDATEQRAARAEAREPEAGPGSESQVRMAPGVAVAPRSGAASAAGSGGARRSRVPPKPTLRRRTEDRVTLVAGAVLGALGTMGVGAIVRSGRAMRRGLRR